MSVASHNPCSILRSLPHQIHWRSRTCVSFYIPLLIFPPPPLSLYFQATRSPSPRRRAASVGALAPPCARAATTSWTAEGRDSRPFQPTCQRAWLRCKHPVSSGISSQEPACCCAIVKRALALTWFNHSRSRYCYVCFFK